MTDDVEALDPRPFRIYDGPSEVHRWSITQRATRRYGTTGSGP